MTRKSYIIVTWKAPTIIFFGSFVTSIGAVVSVESGFLKDLIRRGGEVCHAEMFRANCTSNNEVILVQSARYGRMHIGRCVSQDLGYLGCNADVLRIADVRCSGRRTCQIRIPDAELEMTRPCPRELKTFLDISYVCVPVQPLTSEICRTRREFVVENSTYGFLASIMTSDIQFCDGRRQPWLIRAEVGRQIDIIVYDFSTSSHAMKKLDASRRENAGVRTRSDKKNTSARLEEETLRSLNMNEDELLTAELSLQRNVTLTATQSPRDHSSTERHSVTTVPDGRSNGKCYEYGYIEDSESSPNFNRNGGEADFDRLDARKDVETIPLCVGSGRIGAMYRSLGHQMRIWITAGTGSTDMQRLLIAYTGLHQPTLFLVVGCSDISVNDIDMYFRRTRDPRRAVVGCKFKTEVIENEVECRGNSWIGVFPNCSILMSARQRAATVLIVTHSTVGLPFQALSAIVTLLATTTTVVFLVKHRKGRKVGATDDPHLITNSCRRFLLEQEQCPSPPPYPSDHSHRRRHKLYFGNRFSVPVMRTGKRLS